MAAIYYVENKNSLSDRKYRTSPLERFTKSDIGKVGYKINRKYLILDVWLGYLYIIHIYTQD